MMRQVSASRHAGFTLVELLLAIAVGSVVFGTGLSMYANASSTRARIQAVLSLETSGYFVSQTFRYLLNQTAHRPVEPGDADGPASPIIPVRTSDQAFPDIEDQWLRGEYIKPVPKGLALRFEGASSSGGGADGSMVNCLGQAVPSGTVAGLHLVVDNGVLQCVSAGGTVELTGPADGVSVDRMRVDFGMDNNSDGGVDLYIDDPASASPDATVRTVRAELLMSSLDEVLAQPQPYTFANVTVTPDDKKIRRTVLTTIQVKN